MPNPNLPSNKRKVHPISDEGHFDKKIKMTYPQPTIPGIVSNTDRAIQSDIHMANFILDLYFENDVGMNVNDSSHL